MAEIKEILALAGYCVAHGAINFACYDYFFLKEDGRVAKTGVEIQAGWAGTKEGLRTFFRGSRETVETGDADLGETEGPSLR